MSGSAFTPILGSPLFRKILAAFPEGEPVYLVGGSVRDHFLQRISHDLDFALPGDALKKARKVADALGGAYFPLNVDHNTGRVIYREADGTRFVLDFTRFRGPDLESDLRARDLTINALALDLHNPDVLVDPLGGLSDLRNGLLKPCSPTAFADDPLRILRAVRIAAGLGFRIPPQTGELMRKSLPGLSQISPERIRDELFQLLDGPSPASGIQLLDHFGALEHTFPELQDLKSVEQPPPHIEDVWHHTLSTLREMVRVTGVLGFVHDEEGSADLMMGLLAGRLGRFRERISGHLAGDMNPDRSLRSLLRLAALYHDAGKPMSREVDETGRIRFHEHPRIGAEMAEKRARHLCLGNREVDRLRRIVAHHMRPLFLANEGQAPSRRAVYRYFRDTGEAGVDICLLSLADMLATYGPSLDQDHWLNLLDTVRVLLDAWWEQQDTIVDPAPVLDGTDLIEDLGLQPGPIVGELLEGLREARASGLIETRAEALDLARQLLAEKGQG